MNGFDADYFDGRSSRCHPVRATVEGTRLTVAGGELALEFGRDEVRVLPTVGHTPIRMALPDGGLLVASDAAAVDESLGIPAQAGLARRLESHSRAIVFALAGVVAGGWAVYLYAIPAMADRVARSIPAASEAALGPDTLAAVDAVLFTPSKLAPEVSAPIAEDFRGLVASAGLPPSTRLEFRESKVLGPNAVALPGGIVIVTDSLVGLVERRELAAVLAHELGHVHERHGARALLRGSLRALVSAAVMGDLGALASLAGSTPAWLLQASYSRDFEDEADAFALDLLRRAGRSPSDFAAALRRLGKAREIDPDSDTHSYWSTHPGLAERIRRAEEAR
ncbi:hypothetical protein BWI17_01000 [Betaproteobacteria bacterium GR16-43]|nr:hypothetical protein BWI17_01000 [Betaproteobacteria bacterium GR16-43]